MSAKEVREWAEFFEMQADIMDPKRGKTPGQVEFMETFKLG